MDDTSNDTTSIEVNGHWISPFATRVESGLNQPDTLRMNGRPQLFKPAAVSPRSPAHPEPTSRRRGAELCGFQGVIGPPQSVD